MKNKIKIILIIALVLTVSAAAMIVIQISAGNSKIKNTEEYGLFKEYENELNCIYENAKKVYDAEKNKDSDIKYVRFLMRPQDEDESSQNSLVGIYYPSASSETASYERAEIIDDKMLYQSCVKLIKAENLPQPVCFIYCDDTYMNIGFLDFDKSSMLYFVHYGNGERTGTFRDGSGKTEQTTAGYEKTEVRVDKYWTVIKMHGDDASGQAE